MPKRFLYISLILPLLISCTHRAPMLFLNNQSLAGTPQEFMEQLTCAGTDEQGNAIYLPTDTDSISGAINVLLPLSYIADTDTTHLHAAPFNLLFTSNPNGIIATLEATTILPQSDTQELIEHLQNEYGTPQQHESTTYLWHTPQGTISLESTLCDANTLPILNEVLLVYQIYR